MKRFYKQAQAVQNGDVYEVQLDGRSVKLPESKAPLSMPVRGLAEAIAAEWDAQEGAVVPDSMPLMQIASTCQDKVSKLREAMHDQLMKYVDTDLLFYRTDNPPDLRTLQETAWDPVLDEFETRYGVRPIVTDGLVALSQPQALHDVIDDILSKLPDEAFTVAQIAVPASGSLITGILFTLGALDAERVLSICRVEERHKDGIYDADKYGQDPSIEKADKAMMQDLQACRQYLDLLAAE